MDIGKRLEEGTTSSSKSVDLPDQGMLVEETTDVYGYESVSLMMSLLFLICPSHGRRDLYTQRSESNVSIRLFYPVVTFGLNRFTCVAPAPFKPSPHRFTCACLCLLHLSLVPLLGICLE